MAVRHLQRWLICVAGFVLAMVIMVYLYYEEGNQRYEKSRNSWNVNSNPETEHKSRDYLSEKILIVYYTKTFDKTPVIGKEAFWPYFSAGEECPVKCELSTDKTRASEATALVIHARNIAEAPARDMFPNQTYILHSNEHPITTNVLSDPQVMSQFNYLMSYRLDSDFPCPQVWKPFLSPPVPFSEKRGKVFWASSNCEPIRTQYVSKLMKHIKVDSYGKCLHNAHGLTGPHERMRVGEVSRFYKFQLVFFNQDCDYFVDEKLNLALDVGTIPVVLGTKTIDEFLPGRLKHSIIKVNDFPTPESLAVFLERISLNETAYNKYLQWKYYGLGLPPSYRQTPLGIWWDSPYSLYCRVCMSVATGGGGHKGLRPITCEKKKAF